MIVDKEGAIGAIAEVLAMPDFELSASMLEEHERNMRNAESRKAHNAVGFQMIKSRRIKLKYQS